ncbi:MAG: UDP-N-acetylmuramyl peptide synthase, partial [Candidatus Berkiella sp.]
MDPNSQAYYKSALQLGLPVKEFEAVGGFSLILGKNHYYIFDKNVPWNNASSQLVAGDKFAANMIMAQANIPVPKTR